jgi:hypothetical protein
MPCCSCCVCKGAPRFPERDLRAALVIHPQVHCTGDPHTNTHRTQTQPPNPAAADAKHTHDISRIHSLRVRRCAVASI